MFKMFRFFLFLSLVAILSSCEKSETLNYEAAADIHIAWELVSNFQDNPDAFEARFILENQSADFTLTNRKWTLFFNIAPRPIIDHTQPQPAFLTHINGDWYRMEPNENFSLKPGDRLEIYYMGTEAVIKETDAPLGLYFVFYDDEGNEDAIVEVNNYTILPFERKEQILRGTNDFEELPSAERFYRDQEGLSLVSANEIHKVLPTPFLITTATGKLQIDNSWYIHFDESFEREAAFLEKKLAALTTTKFTKGTDTQGGKKIHLRKGNISVNNKKEEAYTLRMSDNVITITGTDAPGVFYGIQSLLAMVPADAYLKLSPSFEIDKVQIDDAPRFAFRGLHMDVSRNFQTKETILKTLDVMAFYKLNHFLFYTTEDEGWRLEIEGLPELTEVGAQREHTRSMHDPVLHPAYGSGPFAYKSGYHGSGFYSKTDFIEILKYAAERHITIIPELNFPAHARAAIKSMEARYERLMMEGKEDEANEYRLIDPDDTSVFLSAQGYKDNVVSVARESTYRFYQKVMDEIANMYREAGLELKMVHAGGDEVPEGSWTQSPMASELMKTLPDITDPQNLQAYFFRELLKRLEAKGFEVHGWEEVALLRDESGNYVPNPEFTNRKVVPYIWNNMFGYPDLGYKLANAGYEVVLCNVSNFYLDLADNNDPKEPGLYWAGFVNLKNSWAFAPFDFYKTTWKNNMGRKLDPKIDFEGLEKLKPQARKNIRGLEAQLWSETIKGGEMMEYYMLPRLIAFAESAWAKERTWETIENTEQREKMMDQGWNVFVNTLGQKDLPRLSALNGGYHYRIPLPGAVIENGFLKANVEMPGLKILYTTDGTEPNSGSSLYDKPIQVNGLVKLRCLDAAGNMSRTIEVNQTKAFP
ncbi:MAG: carbohydate-binding domain-containing protein [Cyclobacteriaceae bacterium]|nr:carbohydate-binding domain-containing protein [Cyclobacteriaceae bacterium]